MKKKEVQKKYLVKIKKLNNFNKNYYDKSSPVVDNYSKLMDVSSITLKHYNVGQIPRKLLKNTPVHTSMALLRKLLTKANQFKIFVSQKKVQVISACNF